MAVQVRGGQKCLEPLFFVCAASWCRPVLYLGRLGRWLCLVLALRRQVTLRLVTGLNVQGWGLGACQHRPRSVGKEMVYLFNQLVQLRHRLRVPTPRDSLSCIFARVVRKVIDLHPPVVRVAVALLVLLWSAVRGVPGNEEAVSVLPHILPNTGVGLPETTTARLEDGRAAVSRDLNSARGVMEEERESDRLALNYARPRRQHLGDAPNFGHLTFFESARNNRCCHNARALVIRGARGIGAEDEAVSFDRGAWLWPQPRR